MRPVLSQDSVKGTAGTDAKVTTAKARYETHGNDYDYDNNKTTKSKHCSQTFQDRVLC